MAKTANEVFRDFVRFTGDGLPTPPVGHPLPIGDPASGVHNPTKKDIREVIGNAESDRIRAEAASAAAVAAQIDVQGATMFAADRAALLANTATSISVGTIFATRAGDAFRVVSSGGHAITAGGVRLEVLPESGGYNARAFGAVGDGVTDDTDAIRAWASAGGGVLLPGRFRLLKSVTFPRPVALSGAGMGATVLDWPAEATSRGIVINAGTSALPTTVEGMSLFTGGEADGTALLIDYSGNIGAGSVVLPRTSSRVRIRDVQMKGASSVTNTGWLHHIDMVSVVGAHLQGCAVEGRGAGGTILSQTAYRFRGAGAPVECVIDGCWAYQVQNAVYSDEAEGLFVLGCNFVAVGRGVAFTSTGAEPQCQVSDTHINAYVKCVDLNECAQANIHDNLLYSRNDTTNEVIGVDLSASCLYCRVEGNTFVRTGTSTMIAVRDAGDRSVIGRNIIQGATVGIEILAAARLSVERPNHFINCATEVQNASATTARGSLIRDYTGSLDALANSAPRTANTATLAAGSSNLPPDTARVGSFVRTSVFDENAAHQEFDDFATGRQFYRLKKAGVWGSWLRVAALPASGPLDYSGAGSPEGVQAAVVGSTYRRTDGGAGTSFYVKETGAGNTGWVAK